eukprot:GILJ01005552.1.p1 GENE.GILJ01005552.1~~GILJ01005552.1.p1  ORF type:complete len:731 (-),score=69.23 GILJ01005552.1:196-2388(-)
MNFCDEDAGRRFVRQQVTPFWLHFQDANLERRFHEQTQRELVEWKGVYDLVLLILILIYFASGIVGGTMPRTTEVTLTFGLASVYRICFPRFPRWRLALAVGWFVGCLLLVISFTVHSGRKLAGIVLFHHIRIVGGVTVFRRWMPYAVFSCLCEILFFLVLVVQDGRVDYVEEPAFFAALLYGCVLAHVIENQQRGNFLLVAMLDDHQKHWRRFTEVSPDGVIVFGPQQDILYNNASANALLESQIHQSIAGLEVSSRNPLTPAQLFAHIATTCQKDEPVELVCTAHTKQQKVLNLSIVAMRYKWWGADATLFLLRDTTVRLHLDSLRRAASARNLLWASLSHNLRTPLNGILAAVGHLQQELSSSDGVEMVELLQSSTDLLKTFMSDILDYVSIELGQMTLKFAPFDVVELLEEGVRTAKNTQLASHVDLRLQLLSEFPSTFFGDSSRIRQVLMNLLCNALRYTRQGFVIVRAQLSMQVLSVEIQDSGPGVPEHMKSLIFDWLEQATSYGEATSIEETLCGFGLPISKAICAALKGCIGVHSHPGMGATFWFTIPEQQPVGDVSPHRGVTKSGHRRVLIVDDHGFNRVVLKCMLKDTDFVLDEAENGVEAVDLYRQQAYSIILMDISMPIMDGLQATAEIRRLETLEIMAPCIIIAVTAFASDRQEAECLSCGMNAFLSKPVSKGDLLRSIHAAIQQQHHRPDGNDGCQLEVAPVKSSTRSRRPFQVSV